METGTIWFVVSPAAPLQTTSTATSDCQHGSDICLVCLRFWMLSILNALLRATSHFHDGLDFSFLGQCGVRSADTDLYAAALFSKGFHVVATTNLASYPRTNQAETKRRQKAFKTLLTAIRSRAKFVWKNKTDSTQIVETVFVELCWSTKSQRLRPMHNKILYVSL